MYVWWPDDQTLELFYIPLLPKLFVGGTLNINKQNSFHTDSLSYARHSL